MKLFSRTALVLFFVFSLTAGVIQAKGKTYVKPSEIDLIKLLPPPPAQDSEQTKKEIDEILDFQAKRTDKMIQNAVADQDVSVFRFADVLGPDFTMDKLPLTAKFFQDVLANEVDIVGPAKDFWKRPRPSAFDDRVKPCVKVPSNAAYPSGHSAAGNLMAIILANMVPEKSAALYSRGWNFAVNRIIGGVHYRSDSEGGRMAATVIAAFMFNNKQFKADFEIAKAELRKVLALDMAHTASPAAK